MKGFSRPVVALLAIVIVAVLTTVVATAVVVVKRAGARRQPAPTVAAAPQVASPADTADADTTQRPTPIRTRSSRPSQPKPHAAEAAAETQDPIDEAEADEVNPPRPSALIISGDGRTRFQMHFGPNPAPGHLPMVGAAARVRTLGLNEGQRDAIDRYNEAFTEHNRFRLDQATQAMQDAGQALRDALVTQNQQVIQQAQGQMMEAAKKQSEAMAALNKEYVDGVRKYLTDEQAARLDKTVNQARPVVFGYATVQSGDGPTEVRVIAPTVTVNPGGEEPQTEEPE